MLTRCSVALKQSDAIGSVIASLKQTAIPIPNGKDRTCLGCVPTLHTSFQKDRLNIWLGSLGGKGGGACRGEGVGEDSPLTAASLLNKLGPFFGDLPVIRPHASGLAIPKTQLSVVTH